MTFKEVIQAGEIPWTEFIFHLTRFDWLFIFVGLPLFIGLISLIIYALIRQTVTKKYVRKASITVYIALLLIAYSQLLPNRKETMHPATWEEEIAKPYLATLERTKEPITIASINKTSHEKYFEIVIMEADEQGKMTHEAIIAPIQQTDTVGTPTYTYTYLAQDIPGFARQGKKEEIVLIPFDYPYPIQENTQK